METEDQFRRKKELVRICQNWAEMYVTGCIIAESDRSKGARILNSATFSFINTGKIYMAITNWHVIDIYRTLKSKSPSVILQVGNEVIDPEKYIIDENEKLDLVTFSFNSLIDNTFKLKFCSTETWPPAIPRKDDLVVFSGFPGNFVDKTKLPLVEFHSFQFFEFVYEVSEDHLTLHRNLGECDLTSITKNIEEFKNLGGFSGSLICKVDQSKLIPLVPIGIIYEGSSDWQIQLARHLDIIDISGRIK